MKALVLSLAAVLVACVVADDCLAQRRGNNCNVPQQSNAVSSAAAIEAAVRANQQIAAANLAQATPRASASATVGGSSGAVAQRRALSAPAPVASGATVATASTLGDCADGTCSNSRSTTRATTSTRRFAPIRNMVDRVSPDAKAVTKTTSRRGRTRSVAISTSRS